MEEASKMNGDTTTIWTDGSKLENGRVGAGIAWFEGGEEKKRKIEVARRDTRTAGQRREGGQAAYNGRYRSFAGGGLEKWWFWAGRGP